jgi:hypothetical protein
VFENRVLRRIFGPKREEVARHLRRLQNEELHNLYASPKFSSVIRSRKMGLAGNVANTGEVRNVYKILVGKPEENKPFRRPRHR